MFHPTMHTRKRAAWRLMPDARPLPQPWRWPLQRLGNRKPLVLEDVGDERGAVLLGYEARPFDAELYVPVHAAQEGDVMFAGETKSGFAISLDHGRRGWATYYAHMSKMFVAPYYGQGRRKRHHVYAGDVIGYAAKSPIKIRFELWNWTDDRGFVPVDPIKTLTQWIGPLASIREPIMQAA
jgi:murein DD-endopeptidase MepM/ murein hydrolase activator NlpD